MCATCGGSRGVTVTTYKHEWWTCRRCGTTRRVRRIRYPVPRGVPRRFAGLFAPAGLMRLLYPEQDVIVEERRFYDYYAHASSLDVSTTKWAGQIDAVTRRLASAGIDVVGREILDVSGGPGFLTAHLQANGAKRAVMTEFSPEAVEGIQRNLAIDAVKFDYQADDLRDVVTGQFDVAIVDASINFSMDVSGFLGSLRSVLRPGSYAYISFAQPSLGLFLRWQFDEYTYNQLFTTATFDDLAQRAGFSVVEPIEEDPFDYRSGFGRKQRLVTDPWALWYRARAPRGDVPYSRSLKQYVSVRILGLA